MSVKPGDVFEAAIWMDGRETRQQFLACISDMTTAFARAAEVNGVVIALSAFTVMAPGDERVPEVPDHISGPCVTLLVGNAAIVDYAPQASPAGSFVQDLDPIDRDRLRAITRRARRQQSPTAPRLSDAECDSIAERIGPQSALKALRQSVDSRAVH